MCTATKTQLIGQLDPALPGLGGEICDVLGSKVGWLVTAHFPAPARLARLGVERFRDYATAETCGSAGTWRLGWWPPPATHCPPPGAAVARDVLAADLALLGDLEYQIGTAEARIAALLPSTEYQILTTTPGWGVIRSASYAAELGPPNRWASEHQG